MTNKLDLVGIRLVKERELMSDRPIRSPQHAIDLVANEMKWLDREMGMCVYVNIHNHPIAAHVAAIGGYDKAIIDMKNIFKGALLSNASGIVFLHNHPSGNPTPSPEDYAITEKMEEACRLLDIDFLDHIVIGTEEGYSIKAEKSYTYQSIEEEPQKQARLFIDVDGVLAKYEKMESEEALYQKGYAQNLKPQRSVIQAVNTLIDRYPDQCYILSAVADLPAAIEEKTDWVRKHLTHRLQKDHIIFTKYGENKCNAVPGGVQPEDILLDDYTKNLKEFKAAGGIGVKMVNEHNSINGSPWDGQWIYYDERYELQYNKLEEILRENEIKYPFNHPINL